MAKFSMKKGGKEVGPASVYAQPHTMDGKATKVTEGSGKHIDEHVINREWQPLNGVSIGVKSKDVKTSGITMRGAGAATKGTMCRGPMA